MNDNVAKTRQSIRILSNCVRDPNLNANDFCLILYLKYMVWKSGDKYEFMVSVSDMKMYLSVSDNRTIKSSFQNLYESEYLLNAIEEIKPNKPIMLTLNEYKFNTEIRSEKEFYTSLPINVLYGIKDGKLDRKEARLLYYIKSYINYSDPNKRYCYTGIEKTMKTELNMSSNTIPKYTKKLVDKKLIEIEKHNLSTSYQYDEEGNLIFTKYNNHYYINMNALETL
ncbi:hypothetical protein A7312_08995 [Paenibacillus polymyxa]|uniref:Uncharacterized protein n=2 Tax=Paenibacillus TaxID=44249 RepID=A0ABX2ZA31_PAEPO|nr:hypothetical protein A7312_08995 [Paenibacillus polymyxa]